MAGLDPRRVEGRQAGAMGWTTPRPRYAVLDSERGRLLGSLDRALERYFLEFESQTASAVPKELV
jgi:dTDP-4-dehydrorhamnose reductase